MAYRETETTQAKKAGTRARILKEARLLVCEGGFSAAAVAPVAQRSGIAIGTIYRHFPSKADLVTEVFRHACERELIAVTQASQIEGTAAERLTRGVETFALRALRIPRLAYALIAEPVDPLVEQERLSFRFAYAEAFEDVINDGMAQGEFVRQSASISAAALVGMLAEVLVGPLALHASGLSDQVGLSDELSKKDQAHLLEHLIALALRVVGGQSDEQKDKQADKQQN